MRQTIGERDRNLIHIDEALRHETQCQQSAENALLEESKQRGDREYMDPITGLLNRDSFAKQLRAAADRVRNLGEEYSLLVLDIDHFQVVNDVAGHIAGDRLMKTIARLLDNELFHGSRCSRMGTDEFGVLLQGQGEDGALLAAHRLQGEINKLIFEWRGQRFAISVSIGVVHLYDHCPDAIELIRMAYSACRCAQEQNSGISVFDENNLRIQQCHNETRALGRVLKAIEADQLELFCQPILKLADQVMKPGAVHSGEILVRMRDQQGQIVSAGELLSLAERYGFSTKLDMRILSQALEMLSTHQTAFERFDHLAINLSAHSIGNGDFLEFLVEAIGSSGINPKRLCFEITETAAILDIQAASHLIAVVKDLGYTFALDDFGSGHASYLYLRDLDVDYLKIDGDFVRNIATDSVNRSLVQTMVDMGKILGMQVVAEFVENGATLESLADMGVDFVQGYYLGRPKSLGDFLGLDD